MTQRVSQNKKADQKQLARLRQRSPIEWLQHPGIPPAEALAMIEVLPDRAPLVQRNPAMELWSLEAPAIWRRISQIIKLDALRTQYRQTVLAYLEGCSQQQYQTYLLIQVRWFQTFSRNRFAMEPVYIRDIVQMIMGRTLPEVTIGRLIEEMSHNKESRIFMGAAYWDGLLYLVRAAAAYCRDEIITGADATDKNPLWQAIVTMTLDKDHMRFSEPDRPTLDAKWIAFFEWALSRLARPLQYRQERPRWVSSDTHELEADLSAAMEALRRARQVGFHYYNAVLKIISNGSERYD